MNSKEVIYRKLADAILNELSLGTPLGLLGEPINELIKQGYLNTEDVYATIDSCRREIDKARVYALNQAYKEAAAGNLAGAEINLDRHSSLQDEQRNQDYYGPRTLNRVDCADILLKSRLSQSE